MRSAFGRDVELGLTAVLGLVALGVGVWLQTTPSGPHFLRLGAASFLTFVWPGWALVVIVRPRGWLPPVEHLALAIAASAAPLTVLALFAYAARPPMVTLEWLHLLLGGALSGVAVFRIVRSPRRADQTRVDPADWAMAGSLTAFALLLFAVAPRYGPDLREGIDSWFHLGYMTYLSKAPNISPADAFLSGAPPDSRYPYSASHLSLALFWALAGGPLLQAWAFLGPALSLAMLLATYFCIAGVFRQRAFAFAATVCVAAGMLMPAAEPIRLLSPKLSASPAVALMYPYPYAMATRVLTPVLIGLSALYLYLRSTWLLSVLACLALAAGAFHVSQVLFLPLLVCCLVLLTALRGAIGSGVRVAAVVGISLLPMAILVSSAHKLSASFVENRPDVSLRYPVLGSHFVVAPEAMLFPWMLGAMVLALVALLDRRAEKAGPALAAAVVVAPVVNLNPWLAPLVTPYTTAHLLNRLYYPPPSILYFSIPFLVLAVLLARVYERRRAHPWPARALALLAALLVVARVADPGASARVGAEVTHALSVPAPPVPGIAAGILFLFAVVGASLARRRLTLLPETRPGRVVMVACVAALMGGVAFRAIASGASFALPVRNDMRKHWTLNADGEPAFLLAIAANSLPFGSVVCASDPFAAELVPAFARQHTFFYDLNCNPAVDSRALERSWRRMVDTRLSAFTRARLLEQYGVTFFAVSDGAIHSDRGTASAGPAGPLRTVYRDSRTEVWAVRAR